MYPPNRLSVSALRAELSQRNLQLAEGNKALRDAGSIAGPDACGLVYEVGFSSIPSVVYAPDGDGGHGNFLRASFRRIQADPAWAQRLQKVYTASARLPRRGDRRRGELECAGSSDALLMNVFCYPGVLHRRPLCARLGVEPGLRPAFGVRAGLPMHNGEVDRTEMDMALGDVFVEAKLTEAGFGSASEDRLERYLGLTEAFDLEELPRSGKGHFAGYQIVRGVLAAMQNQGRYAVLLDGRREDLVAACCAVLQAARGAAARSCFRLLTWQELAATMPPAVRRFLEEKYGIVPA